MRPPLTLSLKRFNEDAREFKELPHAFNWAIYNF